MWLTIALLFCYQPLNSVCDLCPTWAVICLRKQLTNQDLQRKTIRTLFGSLLGRPGICTHSYLPVIGLMTLIIVNKRKHKADLLLDIVECKKNSRQCEVVIIISVLTVLYKVHSKNEAKVQNFPIYSLSWHKHSLPHYHHLPPGWQVCYDWWT